MKRAAAIATLVAMTTAAATATATAAGDPDCIASYSRAAAQPGTRLRLGVDPGLAGSAGSVQQPAVPDDPARDLAALKVLRPAHRQLVVRVNRLFWSDGAAGIERFRRMAARYARAGFEVEIQVRYHPATGKAGDLRAWTAYVRRVVDALGVNPKVIAMTITNEVNVTFSPNTSDGFYARAQDALIDGIEAAHSEALRRGLHRLKFGFTYAYRFVPSQDAAFFSYLGAHGGARFHRALGFVGLDFYPGTIFPPVMGPGDTYRAEVAQAAGVVRRCLAPKARIGRRVPLWITENGVPTGVLSDAQQAAALGQLVRATSDFSRAFNITDYRWFNLRDSNSKPPATLVGPTFASDGLLRADYSRKPSFWVYRTLVGRLAS